MAGKSSTLNKLVVNLEERAKELNCLYAIEEILQNSDIDIKKALQEVVKVIPAGMQYPGISQVKLQYNGLVFSTPNFEKSPWYIKSDLVIQDELLGELAIYYSRKMQTADEGPFLKEERRLLDSIEKRLEHYLIYHRLKDIYNKWEHTKQDIRHKKTAEWQIIIELISRTDPDIFVRIARRMLNHLIWKGVEGAEPLLQKFVPFLRYGTKGGMADPNITLKIRQVEHPDRLAKKAFNLAAKHLSNQEILYFIQKWIQQDKTGFLIRATSNYNTSLPEIIEAIRRYYQINPEGIELAPNAEIGVRAGLARRFFSEQIEFVNIAKRYLEIRDFHDLIQHLICPAGSHGQLGGKSAGVFLAHRILKKTDLPQEIIENLMVPNTWYLTSDAMLQFIYYNNLEHVMEQKYKDPSEIGKEYPHVVQLYKNAHFPPDIVQGLSMALDDFGTKPLIVRSSSILEDRSGASFTGKYKSLFLANQGNKNERLEALLDAIAEVFASTIGPDPIQYRLERGLIDFHEEMGILIQEVVGKQIGPYYFPAFAGVAFSNNDFRWSSRIRREDGMLRLVPGLGTRAVDRLGDDYPVLIAPGQPGLRVNQRIEDILRYSPQKIDVLNLETNSFETIELRKLLKEFGDEYPAIDKLISIVDHDHLRRPISNQIDFSEQDVIFTFDGLINNSLFIKQINIILKTLQNNLATPVDIEFASDGKDFYLLQCRPQSYSKYDAPATIPDKIEADRILFTANRFITNGTLSKINYVVYVDAKQYSSLKNLSDLTAVGKAIGKLNSLLPKRHFILMGPGRWGSRGDIKLGVNVTYSDINNSAALIEIAHEKGPYKPELSFGTHFFQDLIESSIKYIPLYPDEEGIIFNYQLFQQAVNSFSELVPEYAHLENTIKVLNIEKLFPAMTLQILMNADIEKAVAFIGPFSQSTISQIEITDESESINTEHWKWRLYMAEMLTKQLDAERFGIGEIYLAGSSGNTTAQAASDIDLIINFTGSPAQKKELSAWLEGWSLCLDEYNFIRTGFKAGGLLDTHFVTQKELKDPILLQEKLNINVEGMRKLSLKK
jgi:pyruvate,water dikinase